MSELLTPMQLWSGYSPVAEPLSVREIESGEKNDVSCKKLYFTCETVSDGEVEVFVTVDSKTAHKRAVVIYVGDIFSGVDDEMYKLLVEAGFISDFIGIMIMAVALVIHLSLQRKSQLQR